MPKPEWKFGMVLKRGQARVMFIKFDVERQRMLGGGAGQFVGMRLDHNDRVPPAYYEIGAMGNYSVQGWALEDD